MNLLLFLHLTGVVLLLGNSLTAAFWKIRADSSKDLQLTLQTAKNIMFADYVFTIPSIALILISGHLLATNAGYSVLEWNWLGLSYGLFVLTGVIWLVVLLPAQTKMIREGNRSLHQGAVTKEFVRASRRWYMYGIIATILPIAAMVLMVWKPDF